MRGAAGFVVVELGVQGARLEIWRLLRAEKRLRRAQQVSDEVQDGKQLELGRLSSL
jgi:hypothetical protein